MELNETTCRYWYNYIFDCLSKGFDEFSIYPSRVVNPFAVPLEYKPLRKKEQAALFVYELKHEYLNLKKCIKDDSQPLVLKDLLAYHSPINLEETIKVCDQEGNVLEELYKNEASKYPNAKVLQFFCENNEIKILVEIK